MDENYHVAYWYYLLLAGAVFLYSIVHRGYGICNYCTGQSGYSTYGAYYNYDVCVACFFAVINSRVSDKKLDDALQLIVIAPAWSKLASRVTSVYSGLELVT